MTDALVATLVAGSGAELSALALQAVVETLAQSGASSVRSAWLVEGQAADVFFEFDETNFQHEQRRLPPVRTGEARGGLTNTDASQPSLDPSRKNGREALMATFYATLRQAVADKRIDGIIQPVEGRRKKLLLADMESTIIEQEMLDELAETIGLRDKVAAITARAMNGELDFAAALKERVGLLKGLPVSVLDQVAARITLMPGAVELLATMKANGASAWLVSGGFTCFAKPVAERLGFDRVFANELILRDGFITGEVAEPIVDKNSKKNLLLKACEELGLSLWETATAGDGANDIPMLSACNEGGGLGVAYHAKPNVRAVIPHQINYSDLRTILYAQDIVSRHRL